ncbi:hypothetical protein MSAN_00567100 [Mycena sanguinolenta]|uniref:DUF6534 domain-containing protein n=1 Tax=Mycena sanguinolenta TaxID=230812 RepID=A0A8H6ZA04_9AGAR|nr:hypothetical protein MSAN_00567100 [Mycena sanguinolenta]
MSPSIVHDCSRPIGFVAPLRWTSASVTARDLYTAYRYHKWDSATTTWWGSGCGIADMKRARFFNNIPLFLSILNLLLKLFQSTLTASVKRRVQVPPRKPDSRRSSYTMSLRAPPPACMDPAVSFNSTLGALEIGVLLSCILFGVTTTQIFTYYGLFPEDSLSLKALPAFVWVCELVNTICLGNLMYTYTVSDFLHPERLIGSPVPKTLSVATLFSGLIAASVHGFFAFRIYAFNKQIIIPGLIWFTALLLLLGRVTVFFTSVHAASLTAYLAKYEWLLLTNWSVSVASDFILAATLVVALLSQRSRAHKTTAALMDKLIEWTIETGLLTSVSSIAMLICFATMKTNFIWIAVYAVNTRLFSNSLMASLNSRATLRAMNLTGTSMPSFAAAVEIPSTGVHMKGLAGDAELHFSKISDSV